MTDTTKPTLKIPVPQPVTNYRTSDGKVHASEIDAIAHETFLAVKGCLPSSSGVIGGLGGRSAVTHAYDVVTALARKCHFVPRSAA